MKRFTHDADLRGMVVLRSLGFQLVPFKLHRFRKQRPHDADLRGMVVLRSLGFQLVPFKLHRFRKQRRVWLLP
ncbi:hypothetical protein GO993_21095 [Aeromonas salmonicida subsp. salmonicida]|uniref:hypothetical protein n=1 Tax=Aeromonas salmonicida TaxID=645 RepID=UPI0013201114|nr:hypothetical protein [Aeromonas salmonicida]QHE44685.1 hypothetical protein GO992_16580 [Aeromonas salmonicida subsp. salmonicida]QHE46480.1 hypothetical protein GO994_03315 [Aeromonas salmonicida subsp. salmonicida]QJF57533.1 hypothetical protein GO993_21095 [Aeromonas salmonicida subsp. salmonicida]